MDKDLITFFEVQLPFALDRVDAELKASWGTLTVKEMIDHLSIAYAISLKDEKREILVPAHKLERVQAFLESDLPLPKGFDKPKEYNAILLESMDLAQAKDYFLLKSREMMDFFLVHPEYSSIHPNFGVLDPRQWLLMHRKHIRHHFLQFSVKV